MEKEPGIAFFDFDGTITRSDTFMGFLRYLEGPVRFAWKLTLTIPHILLYLLRVIPHGQLKTRVCTRFLRGKSLRHLEEAAHCYSREVLPALVRPPALQKIRWHQEAGHRVVLVSASADLWLRPFAEEYGLDLIATRLEVRDGLLTGRLQGPNCKGPEKANRIRNRFNLDRYRIVYAYGDSSGDREMLRLAQVKGYRPFHR